MESISNELVICTVDERRYALHLTLVERVVRIVDILPLPNAPSVVTGLVDVGGDILPVVSIRKRFGLPERTPHLNDQMLIIRTPQRRMVLMVDAVTEVMACPHEAITLPPVSTGDGIIEGVITREDGLVLLHNPDRIFSLDEARTLDLAIAHRANKK